MVALDFEEKNTAVLEEDVLEDALADEIADCVRGLSQYWTQRHPIAPFYTLGAAAYLDAPQGSAPYLDKAAATNLALEETFRALYDQMAASLSKHLGESVALTKRFALPGFHIYLPFAAFTQNVASVHWDRQHCLLDWGESPVPQDDCVLTFTVPVALPIGGSGFRIWPRPFSLKAAERDQAMMAPGKPEEYTYKKGRLVVHDGQSLHQAILMPERPFSNDKKDEPADARITLQGHLAHTGDAWEMYW